MFSFRVLISIALLAVAGCASTASTATPGRATATLTPEEQRQLLAEHNRVRNDAGLPALGWSSELAQFAQAWASHLADEGCKLEHRPRSGAWAQRFGENLYTGTAGHFTVVSAVRGWESEKKDYRGGPIRADRSFSAIGHYTQIIWRGTKLVGCGKSLCRGRLIVACNYDPPGNIIGRKPLD